MSARDSERCGSSAALTDLFWIALWRTTGVRDAAGTATGRRRSHRPRAVSEARSRPPLDVRPIDLGTPALAGVDNPQILITQQRVVLAGNGNCGSAVHPLRRHQLRAHTGSLQQSSGRIIKVDRSALYLGGGANAVAAGTVGIPGVVYNLNVSDSLFAFL